MKSSMRVSHFSSRQTAAANSVAEINIHGIITESLEMSAGFSPLLVRFFI
jgi:hypothetical protein